MKDLTERRAVYLDDAIDALNEYFARIGKLKRGGLTIEERAIKLDTIDAIKALPPAQPERKTGTWIPHNIHYTFVTGETSDGGVKCSSCGFETHNKAHITFGCPYKFCPNCGSDNRGKQDEHID